MQGTFFRVDVIMGGVATQPLGTATSIGGDDPKRQLTREQRRALVAESIRAHPQLSDREHGRRVGVDHKTAGSVRRELAESAEIPHFSERVTADGRGAPGTKPKPTINWRDGGGRERMTAAALSVPRVTRRELHHLDAIPAYR